jgi:hypothetical protein
VAANRLALAQLDGWKVLAELFFHSDLYVLEGIATVFWHLAADPVTLPVGPFYFLFLILSFFVIYQMFVARAYSLFAKSCPRLDCPMAWPMRMRELILPPPQLPLPLRSILTAVARFRKKKLLLF